MESFEPGTRCPWTNHTFNLNDRGRKCLSCQRVITLSAWQEKRRCFCGHTTLVEAVARTSTPTQILRTTRPQPSSTGSSNPLVFRPTITTTSSVQSPSSTTSLRSTPSSPGDSPASDSSSFNYGYLALILLFIIIVFGRCTFQSQSSTRSQYNPSKNYPSWNFPRATCGDSNPSGLQDFYPVFVNRTDDSTLQYIRDNYCRDAYLMTKLSTNQKAIQVVSFRSK